jgi:bromodomain adjacent to zinc finger domain protein 1A
MLLCDGCDRGHHMYCLKPKLKAVPTGNWYCNECKPKERNRSPKKRSRRAFNEDEDDEDVKESHGRRKNAVKEEDEVDGGTENDDEDDDENMEVDQVSTLQHNKQVTWTNNNIVPE